MAVGYPDDLAGLLSEGEAAVVANLEGACYGCGFSCVGHKSAAIFCVLSWRYTKKHAFQESQSCIVLIDDNWGDVRFKWHPYVQGIVAPFT
jgi:hypothetical protein